MIFGRSDLLACLDKIHEENLQVKRGDRIKTYRCPMCGWPVWPWQKYKVTGASSKDLVTWKVYGKVHEDCA